MAGALRVQLGGTNHYDGIPKMAALIGQNREKLNESSIGDAVTMMHLTSAITVLLGMLVLGVLQ